MWRGALRGGLSARIMQLDTREKGAVSMTKDVHATHSEEHTIDSRLAGYEALAWKVINGHGYPTTWEEFCEEFKNDSNHAEAVRIAHGIFILSQAIRDRIRKGDAEGAALEALRLEHQAAKLMPPPMGDVRATPDMAAFA